MIARLKSTPLVISLGLAAALITLLAFLAVVLTSEAKQRPFKPEAYFPGLEAKINQATRIHIQSKDAVVDLAFAPETGWTVPSKDGYRAHYEQVQHLALALTDLQRFERKTKDPKWQKRLLLTDPKDKGEATLVQLFDARGTPMAQTLIGLNADVDNAGDKALVYVRAPGDNQVWLARGEGVSTLSANPDDWLDKEIIDLPKDMVVRVDVQPEGGARFAIIHAKPEEKSFVVEGQTGLKLKAASIEALADGLAGLRLRDVARQDRITYTATSPSATYRTTDGLVIRADIAKLGQDYWARLTPTTGEGASDRAKAQVESLKRRLSPWVYQIERWKGDQMVGPLTGLQDLPPEQVPPVPGDVNKLGATPATVAPSTDNPSPPAAHQSNQKKTVTTPNKAKPAKPHH